MLDMIDILEVFMRKIERVNNGIELDGIAINIEIDTRIVNSLYGYDAFDLIKELTNMVSMQLDAINDQYNFSADERKEIIKLMTTLKE